ncbi:hypothetical protein ABZV78_07630 [Micromonospora sp. NPDC004540]|uniref:P-loop NTPase n=1 Tax=Micromonospora sp. NPDC004540 TaxID=3154457 RepID=UPI0033B46A08
MAGREELSVERILASSDVPEAPSGWVVLQPAFFSAMSPDEDLTNFFNGGEPYWEAVVNPRLPRIQIAQSLLDRTRRRMREKKAGIELLMGPTGEGKSTALRQAAAVLALEDSRTILWRQHRDAVLDQKVVDIARACGPGTVIASDNAHLILDQLHELISDGGVPSSSELQLLLATRDTDWTRRTRELGFKLNPAESWKTMGPIVCTKHPFGRVSETDARKIVQSWRTLESSCPDAIQGLSDGEAAKWLSDASRSADSQHGALLGGLLAIRYTPEELRAHLVTLLESLSRDDTPGDMTLADVVIVLAVADVAGADGIPSEVIAGFCDVDELNFRTQVANRLGEEAVANYSDDTLRSRHPMVSEAIFEVAMSANSSFAVESAACHLLAVIAKGAEGAKLRDGYGQVFGLGRELYKARVPEGLAPRARRLGIALARHARELRGSTLANHMSLSECLRLEKQATKAVTTVWTPIAGQLLDKEKWQDWNKNSRTALNEFAITASLAGDELEAAVLRIAALSDNYRANRLTSEKITFTLRGLALHLSRLHLEQTESWMADTLAELHGCVHTCFPDDVDAVAAISQCLTDARVKPASFKTPAAFVLRLSDALARMSRSGSGYLDVELWCARSAFSDLEDFLRLARGRSNA